MSDSLLDHLSDPFLHRLYQEIKTAGPIRAALVDLTHKCNIRCKGCYFFADNMDNNKSPRDEADFDAFIQSEKTRGTNYLSLAGGEPSLMLSRIRKLYDNFRITTVTNGIRKIPYEGLENMMVAVSVWGDHATDTELRGGGKLDVFAKGLANYRNDPRAVWYYTTTAGNAHEIESVTEQCVNNGNRILFNFYGDISQGGGALDHRRGFGPVCDGIDRMIERYPDRVLLTSYMSRVISTGQLLGETWGHAVCGSLTFDHEANLERLHNGKPYSPHFRAYNPDLKSTRRCCTGIERDCSNCFDVWAHFSWIMLNMELHLSSKQAFTGWLTTTYLFYLLNRFVDFESGVKLMPEIHRRLAAHGSSQPSVHVNSKIYQREETA